MARQRCTFGSHKRRRGWQAGVRLLALATKNPMHFSIRHTPTGTQQTFLVLRCAYLALRISSRAAAVGTPISISRSSRPGLLSAESNASGRLVAAMTTTGRCAELCFRRCS